LADQSTSTEPNLALNWRELDSPILREGIFAPTPESQPVTPPQAADVEGSDHLRNPSPELNLPVCVVSCPETMSSGNSGLNSFITGGEGTGNIWFGVYLAPQVGNSSRDSSSDAQQGAAVQDFRPMTSVGD